ncbi:MAG: RHS repeat-associated core domain-containing protein [Planctomycetota bacterium]|nr:MAG: RHS repeat-associated core domain-containing protein [Planctomycetota bacterium]
MNVTGLVDASTGAVVERYHYDPYGKVLYLDGSWNLLGTQASAFENDYLYTGRRLDAETDLFYYRARYYDTSLGRFISRDPIGYGDGPNLYKYVGGRPTMRVDPQGLAENGTLVLQGAGAGSIGAEVALAGRTLVQIGGEPFYVSSSGPSGVWSPKNSTTAFFVYKKSNPSKMYRLDYHSLPTGSNGPGVWHHNQKGVNRYAGLRATNHSVTTSSKFTGRALTVLKWGGRGVFVVSVGMSAVDIYYAESKARAVTKTVGGFAGAYAGGWAGAKGGAATGVFIAGVVGQAGPQLATPEEIVTVPAGGIIGGFLGGIGGGILGAFIGTEVAETVYDWMFTPLEKEEWIVVCEAGPTLDTGYGGFLEPGDY